jgi:undecaprenyl-diphosphatase
VGGRAEPVDGLGARTYIGLIILGNVPAILVGFTLKDRIEALFDNPWAVFAAMAATAVVLFRTRGARASGALLGPRAALLIGCAQAVAILPGASRSGWTIAVALGLGLKGESAARYSFLLSIPAIMGAALLETLDSSGSTTPVGALVLGFVVAALTGLFALRWLVALVRRMELYRFAWYLCTLVLVGGLVLLVYPA